MDKIYVMYTNRSRADGLSLGFFCKLTHKIERGSEYSQNEPKIYEKLPIYIYLRKSTILRY